LGLLSCPLKGESCVTSWGCNRVSAGGGRLGHGGVFVFVLMSQVFFWGEKKRVGGKIRSDLKNCNPSWSL
jgi:hypothetical protein